MKLPNEFWVVTKPSTHSEFGDIIFTTDLPGLQRQFKGGLDAENIIGIYSDKDEAISIATNVMNMALSDIMDECDCE